MPQTLKQEFTDEIQEKTNKANKNVEIAKKLSLRVETGILEIVTDYEIQLQKNEEQIKQLKEENQQIIEKKDKEIEEIKLELKRYKETNDKFQDFLSAFKKNTPESKAKTTTENVEAENDRKRKRASVVRQTADFDDEEIYKAIEKDLEENNTPTPQNPKRKRISIGKRLSIGKFSGNNSTDLENETTPFRICIILPPTFKNSNLAEYFLSSPDNKSKFLMLAENSRDDLTIALKSFLDQIDENKFWYALGKHQNLQKKPIKKDHIILRFIVPSKREIEHLQFDLESNGQLQAIGDGNLEEEFLDDGQYFTQKIDGVEPYQFIEISHEISVLREFSSKIVDNLADRQEYQGDNFFRDIRKKNLERRGSNQKNFWYETDNSGFKKFRNSVGRKSVHRNFESKRKSVLGRLGD